MEKQNPEEILEAMAKKLISENPKLSFTEFMAIFHNDIGTPLSKPFKNIVEGVYAANTVVAEQIKPNTVVAEQIKPNTVVATAEQTKPKTTAEQTKPNTVVAEQIKQKTTAAEQTEQNTADAKQTEPNPYDVQADAFDGMDSNANESMDTGDASAEDFEDPLEDFDNDQEDLERALEQEDDAAEANEDPDALDKPVEDDFEFDPNKLLENMDTFPGDDGENTIVSEAAAQICDGANRMRKGYQTLMDFMGTKVQDRTWVQKSDDIMNKIVDKIEEQVLFSLAKVNWQVKTASNDCLNDMRLMDKDQKIEELKDLLSKKRKAPENNADVQPNAATAKTAKMSQTQPKHKVKADGKSDGKSDGEADGEADGKADGESDGEPVMKSKDTILDEWAHKLKLTFTTHGRATKNNGGLKFATEMKEKIHAANDDPDKLSNIAYSWIRDNNIKKEKATELAKEGGWISLREFYTDMAQKVLAKHNDNLKKNITPKT